MGGLLAGLATLAKPILSRVLLALGMSVVTIGGVGVTLTQLKSAAVNAFSGAPMAALELAGLAGCWTAMGIIFGAMSFCVSYWTLTKATSLLGTA